MTSISPSIDGVVIQPLKQIKDDRGAVLHMLRADSPLFLKFGEVYFSEVFPGAVKAWKRHKKMTQLFAVPVGQIDLVIYDDRPGSATKGKQVVLKIGRDNYQLVKIPPRLWYGFKCTSPRPAIVANCADLPHDPDESESIDPRALAIPYQW
ncbi:MAG: dTDP-4-dehydrorhamnose 3,5-epimerase family protein [Deltaproteobacteria bacterium]|nr:dTDP-4-dehydrorhamnose 3,5-epimerase family protein [Deltaproteobacteria bacterium]